MHFSSKGMFFSLLMLVWNGINGALAKPGENTGGVAAAVRPSTIGPLNSRTRFGYPVMD